MRTLPLGVRIVLLVVPLALLPLATVGGVTYYYLEATVRAESDATHLRQLSQRAAAFDRALAEVQTVAHALSHLPQIGRIATSRGDAAALTEVQQVLGIGMRLSPAISRILLVRQGAVIVSAEAEPDRGAADGLTDGTAALLASLASRGTHGRLLVESDGSGLAVAMVEPVDGGPPPEPSVVVVASLTGLVGSLEPSPAEAATCLLLVDTRLRILARSGTAPAHLPTSLVQAAVTEGVTAPRPVVAGEALPGFDAFVQATAPMPDGRAGSPELRPLYFVYLLPRLPLAARLDELRRMAIFLAGTSLAFGLIGAGLLARSVVHPIDALLDMARLIGQGQFDVRLQKVRDDEIGQLVEAFNTMTASIADYRDKLIRAETFAALGRVASTVAHEVRNPLNAMRGCIEYLRLKRPDDAVVRHHAGIIAEEIAELDSFVTDFLRVTRIERPRLAPTDLGALLKARTALHEPAATRRNIRLSLTLPREPVRVSADAQQIGIVLENLVNNAIEAMPQGGDLTIRAEADAETARVAVSDTGDGIPADVQKNLFTPFFSTKADGAGIGLAISRRIAEAHGGRLEFDSVPGAGTTFRLELPLSSDGDAESSAP